MSELSIETREYKSINRSKVRVSITHNNDVLDEIKIEVQPKGRRRYEIYGLNVDDLEQIQDCVSTALEILTN